ncbi:hypothetical protein [Rhizobium ruizarguesonis]|uniref:hypothetical protein n=1 Tax=Rhizobium ruizarguesonis TaxID=2081791 RepID=UPI0010311302|nr:hypothetical protein [Rhizobium ruizarguesonis]TAV04517.1 hypothetical protein ELI39_04030 [Rhizobium ruizarguesonis]
MTSVFFPISVRITQKTVPNVKVAAITNASFVMDATQMIALITQERRLFENGRPPLGRHW